MLARRLLLRGSFLPSGTPPFSLEGPYDPARSYDDTVLTQLHCHTTESDGSHSPTVITNDYLGAGYRALAITDHNKVTAQSAGMETAIQGNELTSSVQHIISIGSSYASSSTNAQSLINEVLAAGGQCHIAHPKWSVGMSTSEMAALTGQLGLEIHNAKVIAGAGQNPVTYPGFALTQWDELLTTDRLSHWAFSVDDLHQNGTFETWDIGRVQVFAQQNDIANLMAALVHGDFVADVSNHGVTPGVPERTVDGVSLTCTGATRIEAIGSDGALLAFDDSDTLAYDFAGDELYVRLVAVGQYVEPFTSALSDRWRSDSGTWSATGGVLNLANTTTGRIILRRHRAEDFTVSFDAKLSGSTTNDRIQLIFNVLNGSYYYAVHIGRSTVAEYDGDLTIGKTTNNSLTAASVIGSTPFSPTAGTWYTVDVDYVAASGTIRARAYEQGGSVPDWMVTVSDTTWKHGAFGFRAGGNAQIDNLTIDGFRTYYQPIPVSV